MFSNIRNSCLLLTLLSFSGTKAISAADSAVTDVSAKKMNVYFIRGLGADERVFTKLKLDPRLNVKYIKWVRPLKKESLQHYAARLSNGISLALARLKDYDSDSREGLRQELAQSAEFLDQAARLAMAATLQVR